MYFIEIHRAKEVMLALSRIRHLLEKQRVDKRRVRAEIDQVLDIMHATKLQEVPKWKIWLLFGRG